MPREHGESGEFVKTVSLDDVLAVFDAVEGPVILSADVADELDCSRETARRKLETLHDRGDLEWRKVARRVIYWPPERDEKAADTAEAPVRRDESGDHGGHAEAKHAGAASRDTDALDTVDFPATRERDACEDAVHAARDYIRANGGTTKAELVRDVMPEHALGYDVDAALAKVGSDERYRGGWWRSVVKPGLEALDDVEKPPRGRSTWKPAGET